MKTFYLKSIMVIPAYTLAGAIVGLCGGYLCGAIGGLIMTFYNNHFLSNTAQAGYFWWAHFGGIFVAYFAVLPGAVSGFPVGLIIYRQANSALPNKIGKDRIL